MQELNVQDNLSGNVTPKTNNVLIINDILVSRYVFIEFRSLRYSKINPK